MSGAIRVEVQMICKVCVSALHRKARARTNFACGHVSKASAQCSHCCLHICCKHHFGAKSLGHDVIGNSFPIHTVQSCFHSQILRWQMGPAQVVKDRLPVCLENSGNCLCLKLKESSSDGLDNVGQSLCVNVHLSDRPTCCHSSEL